MRGTQGINEKGHLTIGGVDSMKLVEEYGSPLFVYDIALIKEKVAEFKSAFSRHQVRWQVAYASKAFSSIAMIQLMNELDLSLDVVSGGELFTALKAGFPSERIHFHGNNKTQAELEYALEERIGTIIIDNFYELSLLNQLCKERQQTIDILLRTTPGVQAHTHSYIMTGQEDSKFGFNLDNGSLEEAIQKAQNSPFLILKGLHCHIGSQIFSDESFVQAINKMFQKLREWKQRYDFEIKVLNVGGGFGIKYSAEDTPLMIGEFVDTIVSAIVDQCDSLGIAYPEIWVEPGRILVAEAGTTLYTIGAFKDIPQMRKYISVDGGMTDNLRPALYQAKYECLVANKAPAPADDTVTIAGKCCESGDILIWDAKLPSTTEPNDILAVFCTGAYGYAMANHYNRMPKPAVVFVENGSSQLVIQRETYEDLIKHELPLKQSILIN
ncbi:diaminopimelate decarboxylase [Scopulibacillus daqui]|uniref:Diaminopimelate decarboxylase n=2 Tax=Scopulibacillus daqui TaxID=1469162 RepID=A0ABS2Q215_9BACL|nr:diaminopimelate decarboxylase [Scopulibacillus daqui]MBM7646241.1 diaminopimelate decarboxylase [Scopulibacillus daqui]